MGETVTPYTNGNPGTSTTSHFVFDLQTGNMVVNLTNSGGVNERMLSGPAVDQILAEENSSGTVTWALMDNQGTVRDLAQYSSAWAPTTITNQLVYTAFGQLLSTPPTNFQFGYTGSYFDMATGLLWSLNGWYNASIQRWMTQGSLGVGVDANQYRYCGNGPTNSSYLTGTYGGARTWRLVTATRVVR